MLQIHLFGFKPATRQVAEQVMAAYPIEVVVEPTYGPSSNIFVPDAIICDISSTWEGVPGHIESFRNRFPDCYLMVTGDFAEDKIIEQILAVGANAYLPTYQIPIRLIDELAPTFPSLIEFPSIHP